MATPPFHLARDLRIDFFRGLALLMIFVDHINANPFHHITLEAFAFNNAFEVFIFLSGYTAALVYGHRLRTNGWLYAIATIYRRVWQVYVAQIFTLALFIVAVRYVAVSLHDPHYIFAMGLDDFTGEPYHAMAYALFLGMQPSYFEILPLYIVFLAGFPLVLFLQERSRYLPLLLSGAVYLLATHYGWAFYPTSWKYNPICLQFLFIIGATVGHRHLSNEGEARWEAPVAWTALGLAVMCTVIRLTWTVHHNIDAAFPALFHSMIAPYWQLKSLLPWPRLFNMIFLAVAALYFVRPDSAFLRARWARPVILCGQQSLYLFCFGILLSIFAHLWADRFADTLAAFGTVSALGIAALIGMALLIDRFRAFTATTYRIAARPAVEYPGQFH